MTRLRTGITVVMMAAGFLLLPNVGGVTSRADGDDDGRRVGTRELAFGNFFCDVFEGAVDDFILLVNIGYFEGTAGVFSTDEVGDLTSRTAVDEMDPALCDPIVDEFQQAAEKLGCTSGSPDSFDSRRRFSFVCTGRRERVVRAVGNLSELALTILR